MNILYLDLDSLRPDHLGCYGYHRDTSPNLDALAREGTVFKKVYCSDAPCCPSRTALMSGRFGINNGLVCHHGTAGDIRIDGPSRGFTDRLAEESVPATLQARGYHTASISPFYERHSAWWFVAGFAEVINTGKRGMEGAEDVTPTALEWLKKQAQEEGDWFLHLNYWDPHMPSRTPEEFGNPFADEPLPEFYNDELIEHLNGLEGMQMPREKEIAYRNYRRGNFVPRWPSAREERIAYPRCPDAIRTFDDVKLIVDSYDASVRYLDEHLGRLFDEMKRLGQWDNTLILVSADHGENLGELGIFGDHKTADETTTHIPLIARLPGGKQGHVDEGLHYHLDMGPTIAEVLGYEAPESWDGRSYAKTLTDGADTGWDSLTLSVGWGTMQRSARFGDWMYTRTYHCGYNFFPDEMLFNVAEDPHQTTNLAEKEPALCQKGQKMIDEWRAENLAKQPEPYGSDPFDTVLAEGGPMRGPLKGYLKRLEERGKEKEATYLRERYASEL